MLAVVKTNVENELIKKNHLKKLELSMFIHPEKHSITSEIPHTEHEREL